MKAQLSFYVDRQNPLHRANPLTKVLLVFTLITLTFFGPGYWLPTALFGLVLAPLSFLGQVQREFFNAVTRLLLPVVGFLFVMQSFFYPGGETAIFRIWVLSVTYEGVAFAFLTTTRILVMVSSFILFLLTTHPSDLMSDLTRRGLSGMFSYVITSTIQIVPQMQAKATTIIDAQRARGLKTEGGLRQRMGALLPLVGPLVFGSLVEVEERAIAIEARAFTSKLPKTSLREIKDTTGDKVVRGVLLILILLAFGWRLWP